jgi:hypothetical protein
MLIQQFYHHITTLLGWLPFLFGQSSKVCLDAPHEVLFLGYWLIIIHLS